LSACQTAAGDDRAALGLAGIAIKAGAQSAVATLWLINDAAAAEMMPAFYTALATPGMTKAKAMQKAQVTLLADSRFAHPSYWAAFMLIGNWQ
jgi:CHAT domain-containing protein